MAKLFANSGSPDQMPRSAASDLGLHCLPSTLLRVSRLQWVNKSILRFMGSLVLFIFMMSFTEIFMCHANIVDQDQF